MDALRETLRNKRERASSSRAAARDLVEHSVEVDLRAIGGLNLSANADELLAQVALGRRVHHLRLDASSVGRPFECWH